MALNRRRLDCLSPFSTVQEEDSPNFSPPFSTSIGPAYILTLTAGNKEEQGLMGNAFTLSLPPTHCSEWLKAL